MSPVFLSSTIGISVYYLLCWALVGRDPKPGPIVTIYDPPREISPAMLRYVWKQVFDDRTVWSNLLSIVSKGLARMESRDGGTMLHLVPGVVPNQQLPLEELIFFEELLHSSKKSGMSINVLDGRTSILVTKMAEILRQTAVGRWFQENRQYVTIGAILSAVALCFVAAPHNTDGWFALVFSMVFMAPGAFYSVLLLVRIRDLLLATRSKFDAVLIRRILLLAAFLACCLSSILTGAIVLGVTFGWSIVALAGIFAFLGLSFLNYMKAPTDEGRKLLNEIEGFRLFLNSVEQPTMDRSDAPDKQPGVYEKYLPYAVALEVEQAWCDQSVALASSYHHPEPLVGAQSLYLGMWNGKPVEILYKPEPIRRVGP